MTALVLVVLVLLLLLLMIVVLAEAALNHTSAVRLEVFTDRSPERVQRVSELADQPDALINPLRMAAVGLLLAEGSVAAVMANRWLDLPWVMLALAVNFAVVFVLGDVLPRTLGILHADRVALALGPSLGRIVGSSPVRLVSRALIGTANVVMPGKGLRQGPFARPEEFIALADAAVADAVLEPDDRDLIESVIEFGGTVVREVMVPRTDMTAVEVSASVGATLELTSQKGFSRVPAVGENVDDVVGLVYVKDLIRAELDGAASNPISEFLRKPRFVPETKKVAELLREMQQETFHMAVVVDEYGGVAGLVTLEDLIEELVGEIVDEYDVEEPLVERIADGSLRADARILIDELNDLGGLKLPEGDYDTLGGLVFDVFGRVPSVGESCETNGYELRVERVQGRRVTRVRVLASGRR